MSRQSRFDDTNILQANFQVPKLTTSRLEPPNPGKHFMFLSDILKLSRFKNPTDNMLFATCNNNKNNNRITRNSNNNNQTKRARR